MRRLLYIICLLYAAITATVIAIGQVVVSSNPVVVFTYDASGNVTSRTVMYEAPDWGAVVDDSIGVDTGIIAYPNPTIGPLNARANKYSGDFPIHYEIYDDRGVLVRRLSSTQEITDVSLNESQTGNYILRALRGDSVIAIQVLKVN